MYVAHFRETCNALYAPVCCKEYNFTRCLKNQTFLATRSKAESKSLIARDGRLLESSSVRQSTEWSRAQSQHQLVEGAAATAAGMRLIEESTDPVVVGKTSTRRRLERFTAAVHPICVGVRVFAVLERTSRVEAGRRRSSRLTGMLLLAETVAFVLHVVISGPVRRRRRGRRSGSSRRQTSVSLPLHLGAVVLEPQLKVLRLQPRKALTIRRPIQLFRVLLDDVRRRMRIVGKPAFQSRYFGQRVDEHPAALRTSARLTARRHRGSGRLPC